MDLIELIAKNLGEILYIFAGTVISIAVWKIYNTRNSRKDKCADAPNRIQAIAHGGPPKRTIWDWVILVGVLCFLGGFMPFIIGAPIFLVTFIGIPLAICIIEWIKNGRTNWNALFLIAGIIIEAAITFFLPTRTMKSPDIQIILIFTGLLIMFIALFFRGRTIRRNWIRVRAKRIAQEIYEDDDSDGKSWYFQLLCEFEIDGRAYRVTPGFWRSFATKAGVSSFLSKRITPDGICELHVNPGNPLETEFAGNDIKDFLLH
jgi:hypothetical protein